MRSTPLSTTLVVIAAIVFILSTLRAHNMTKRTVRKANPKRTRTAGYGLTVALLVTAILTTLWAGPTPQEAAAAAFESKADPNSASTKDTMSEAAAKDVCPDGLSDDREVFDLDGKTDERATAPPVDVKTLSEFFDLVLGPNKDLNGQACTAVTKTAFHASGLEIMRNLDPLLGLDPNNVDDASRVAILKEDPKLRQQVIDEITETLTHSSEVRVETLLPNTGYDWALVQEKQEDGSLLTKNARITIPEEGLPVIVFSRIYGPKGDVGKGPYNPDGVWARNIVFDVNHGWYLMQDRIPWFVDCISVVDLTKQDTTAGEGDKKGQKAREPSKGKSGSKDKSKGNDGTGQGKGKGKGGGTGSNCNGPCPGPGPAPSPGGECEHGCPSVTSPTPTAPPHTRPPTTKPPTTAPPTTKVTVPPPTAPPTTKKPPATTTAPPPTAPPTTKKPPATTTAPPPTAPPTTKAPHVTVVPPADCEAHPDLPTC